MEKLFDIVLQYKKELAPLALSGNQTGKLLGSGDGQLKGEKLAGTVRWDIYEKGGVVTGDSRCQTNITGIIEAEDGAQIHFDSTGYGFQAEPDRWTMVATLNFTTSDERYAWLRSVLGIWSGQFDTQTGQHRYQAFAPPVKGA